MRVISDLTIQPPNSAQFRRVFLNGKEHAALDELIRVTRPGGHLVFSISQPAFDESGFKEKLAQLDSAGLWQSVFVSRDYYPLPDSASEGDLTAKAYVYQVV